MTTPRVDAAAQQAEALRRQMIAEMQQQLRQRAVQRMLQQQTAPRADSFRAPATQPGQVPGVTQPTDTQVPQQVAVDAVARALGVPPERVNQLLTPEQLQTLAGDAQAMLSAGTPDQAVQVLAESVMRDPVHLETMARALHQETFGTPAPAELTESPAFEQLAAYTQSSNVPSGEVSQYLRSRFLGTQGPQWAQDAGLPVEATPFQGELGPVSAPGQTAPESMETTDSAASAPAATDPNAGTGGSSAGMSAPTETTSYAAQGGPGGGTQPGTPGATPGGQPGQPGATETTQQAATIVNALQEGFDRVPDAYPGDHAPKAAIAAWMGKMAMKAGLPPELPIMAGLVESGLRNLNHGDRDSIGYFQMRTGIWNKGKYAGYGQDPAKQMQWFIDTALQVRSKHGYTNENQNAYGEWIANIERPAAQYRGRYQPKLQEARALLSAQTGLDPNLFPNNPGPSGAPGGGGTSGGGGGGSSGGGGSVGGSSGGGSSGGGASAGGGTSGGGSVTSPGGGTTTPGGGTTSPGGSVPAGLDQGTVDAARGAGLDVNFFAKMMKSLWEFSKWMEEQQGKSLAAVLENNPAFQAWVLKKTGKPLEKGKVSKELINQFMAEQMGGLDVSKGGNLDMAALAMATQLGIDIGAAKAILQGLDQKLGLGLASAIAAAPGLNGGATRPASASTQGATGAEALPYTPEQMAAYLSNVSDGGQYGIDSLATRMMETDAVTGINTEASAAGDGGEGSVSGITGAGPGGATPSTDASVAGVSASSDPSSGGVQGRIAEESEGDDAGAVSASPSAGDGSANSGGGASTDTASSDMNNLVAANRTYRG